MSLTANGLIDQPIPLGYVACAIVAAIFVIGGLFGLKTHRAKSVPDSSESIWPLWSGPFLYVVVGLGVLVLSL
jgi:hypothetical protein